MFIICVPKSGRPGSREGPPGSNEDPGSPQGLSGSSDSADRINSQPGAQDEEGHQRPSSAAAEDVEAGRITAVKERRTDGGAPSGDMNELLLGINKVKKK